MAAITQSATAGLGLLLPVPGATPGLGVASPGESWLELLNTALNIIDGHDHSTGKGLPVASASFSVTSPLSFNGYDATAMRTVRFTDTVSFTSADLGCIYRNGADLYYRDTAGNAVRITSGGAVNVGATGSIVGMTGSSTVTYVDGTSSYLFQKDATTFANLRGGSVFLRRVVSGVTAEVELRSPTLSPGSYAIIFPPSLPGSQTLVTLAATGDMATIAWSSTVQLSGGAISVAPASIGNTHLAVNAVSTDRIVDGSVTKAKQAAVGQVTSAGSGVFTTSSAAFVAVPNLSAAVTTVGRPVQLVLQPDAVASSVKGFHFSPVLPPAPAIIPADVTTHAALRIMRGAVEIFRVGILYRTYADTAYAMIMANEAIHNLVVVDAPAVGTYTYAVQVSTEGTPINVDNMLITVREL